MSSWLVPSFMNKRESSRRDAHLFVKLGTSHVDMTDYQQEMLRQSKKSDTTRLVRVLRQPPPPPPGQHHSSKQHLTRLVVDKLLKASEAGECFSIPTGKLGGGLPTKPEGQPQTAASAWPLWREKSHWRTRPSPLR